MNEKLITKEDLIRENVATKRYLVALQVGGIMEHPEYTYQDYQIIEAKSRREAEDIYNKKNNCNYYYGSVIRVLGHDENYVPEIDDARKTCITPVSFRKTIGITPISEVEPMYRADGKYKVKFTDSTALVKSERAKEDADHIIYNTRMEYNLEWDDIHDVRELCVILAEKLENERKRNNG